MKRFCIRKMKSGKNKSGLLTLYSLYLYDKEYQYSHIATFNNYYNLVKWVNDLFIEDKTIEYL